MKKAVLTLLLPAVLFLAGMPAARAEAPVKKEQAAPAAAVKPGRHTLSFSPVSRPALLKKYPSIRNIIEPEMDEETKKVYIESRGEDSAYAYATVRDKAMKVDLLLVSISSPFYCGTAGCALIVFSGQDGKYKQLQYFVVPDTDVGTLKKDGKLSLLLPTMDGYGMWAYKDGKLRHTGSYVPEQSFPPPQEPAKP